MGLAWGDRLDRLVVHFNINAAVLPLQIEHQSTACFNRQASSLDRSEPAPDGTVAIRTAD